MKRRLNMVIIAALLTIIVFIATTAVQKIFVNYEPTVKVLVAGQDIQPNKPLDKFMFKTAQVPLSLVMNVKVIKSTEDIEGQYSLEPLHKGEILRDEAIAFKNEVKIIEIESGREKISVKIKAPENAVSYQIKTGDRVNLYFTAKYGFIKNLSNQKQVYLADKQNAKDGDYCTIKVLENQPILGIFDCNGGAIGYSQREAKIDTVIFSVTHEDAVIINNIRTQGIFDITGLPYTQEVN